MTAQQLLDEYNGCKEFYKDGGITVTGGEPLMQIDFVTELFELFKSCGIHTCLDTSGITFNENTRSKFDRLIQYTDLILLDLKHIDPVQHKELTAHSNDNILNFARYLADNNVPMWIRHVVVPNLTDDEQQHYLLGRFIGTLKSVKALDVLPYHDMGVKKYEALGIDYPLKGTPPAEKELALKAKQAIMCGIKDVRAGR